MAENKTESRPADILVVEDEVEIRELISMLLLRQGYRVQQSSSALDASENLKTHQYDLIILDWMLPQMSGIDFLKSLHGKTRPPVLMITAKAEPQDIVQGLEAGADDYITKPFEPSIFTARAKALLRRTRKDDRSYAEEEKIIGFGELKMNLETYEVTNFGQTLHLTPSEFKITAEMAKNKGKVLTRDYLIKVVQGDGVTVTGRTIDTHVFGLRKKLGPTSDWIETIRGVGYRVRFE